MSSSALPSWYSQALSMKVMPLSMASWRRPMHSVSLSPITQSQPP